MGLWKGLCEYGDSANKSYEMSLTNSQLGKLFLHSPQQHMDPPSHNMTHKKYEWGRDHGLYNTA